MRCQCCNRKDIHARFNERTGKFDVICDTCKNEVTDIRRAWEAIDAKQDGYRDSDGHVVDKTWCGGFDLSDVESYLKDKHLTDEEEELPE
jgi:hypothetical protein